MLVCTVTDCVFNVSSVKDVDYGILSWTHYLNLMVHYYCLSKLDMAGLSSRSSRGLVEVCSIKYTKCLQRCRNLIGFGG